MAPLTTDHRLDRIGWERDRVACHGHRFRPDQNGEQGRLVRRHDHWALVYGGTADAAPGEQRISFFTERCLTIGGYVAITGRDGVEQLFRVIRLAPIQANWARNLSALALHWQTLKGRSLEG